LREILIFAGTTEGRKLSKCLSAAGVGHSICVATEYGEIVQGPDSLVNVHRGRMGQEEIRGFLQKGDFAAVVDATHPYAETITSNIKGAMEGLGIPRLRLERDREEYQENAVYFQGNRECARALESIQGNILLTIGGKGLGEYCISQDMKNRLYVRVLPSMESISRCMEQGICGRQIIAMQGPFTTEMNEAMIRQYGISCLVTKESGKSGGYGEKLEAARRTGAAVYVIGRPKTEEGSLTFDEVCRELEKICGRKIGRTETCRTGIGVTEGVEPEDACLEIILAGAGMGNGNCLTKEVQEAINTADILLGAERLLACCKSKAETHPFYQAKEILPFLKGIRGKKAVVLFSGDSGFYSGCRPVYEALEREIRQGGWKASLRVMPGISSVAFLASCIGESYEDAAVYSTHGKALGNLVHKIRCSRKTFLLTSGVRDVNRIGRLLEEAGMSGCQIVTGYQLSYKEQEIRACTPRQCRELEAEGLYTCFIKNPCAKGRHVAHGIRDGEFIRDKVPMTKEEVREVSICKLKLHQGAVVYDIGSGTGSVAVETARLSDDIQVYAIERKKEAVSLIQKNIGKFGLENITITQAEAPEGLLCLPAATHAFIGGSGGRLKEVLDALQQINPGMRVVVNAVSMETICEIREILEQYKIEEEEILQLQVSRAGKAGNYHLMQAENPVWICAFRFAP